MKLKPLTPYKKLKKYTDDNNLTLSKPKNETTYTVVFIYNEYKPIIEIQLWGFPHGHEFHLFINKERTYRAKSIKKIIEAIEAWNRRQKGG